MKKLQTKETELIGARLTGDRMDIDAKTCERIDWLLNNALDIFGYGEESGGWDKLYRDPADGRFWLLTYPFSEMHGGGPPTLRHLALTENEARARYVSPDEWHKRMEKFMRDRNIRFVSPDDDSAK